MPRQQHRLSALQVKNLSKPGLYGVVGIVTTVGVLIRWPKLLTG